MLRLLFVCCMAVFASTATTPAQTAQDHADWIALWLLNNEKGVCGDDRRIELISGEELHRALATETYKGASEILIYGFAPGTRLDGIPEQLKQWLYQVQVSGGRVERVLDRDQQSGLDFLDLPDWLVDTVATGTLAALNATATETIFGGLKGYNVTVYGRSLGAGNRSNMLVDEVVFSCR